jgi:hypothetical protein
MKRVAILYGTAEGPALTWRLKPVLLANGYDIIKDISSADCVVTHSGGVLELPPELSDKLVMIVVPSTGYTGSLANAAVHKIILDIKHAIRHRMMLLWLRKTAINIWYGLNVPRIIRLYKINKRLSHALPPCVAKKVVVLVQPHDPWSRDLPPETVKQNASYTYLTIPGQHDDIWAHPDAYVSILKKFD